MPHCFAAFISIGSIMPHALASGKPRAAADIDELHVFLCALGAKIVRAPREDQWAPGYYSLLFEDPDGIRLELNHVPGKGLLA